MSGSDASPAASVLTRRRFFESLAAVGGMSLVLSGMEALGFSQASATELPPTLTGGAKNTKVIILGAGLAGMTAAYEMSKAGYQVQILEARDYAGGRCQTARKGFKHTDLLGNTQVCEFDDGHYINHGAWRIPYHHRSTLHYTKSFGVLLESFVNDNDASYVYFEKGKGPLNGKPVRKGEIAADVRGYTAELVAKAASAGALDAPLSGVDRERFVAYLVNEGRLSKSDLTYKGTEGAVSRCIRAPASIRAPARSWSPSPSRTCSTATPGGCSARSPAMSSSAPCCSRSAVWTRSPRRSKSASRR